MADLIDRQTSIEAVEGIVSSMSVCMSIDECKGMKRMQKRVVEVLTDLPSALDESGDADNTETGACSKQIEDNSSWYIEDNSTWYNDPRL